MAYHDIVDRTIWAAEKLGCTPREVRMYIRGAIDDRDFCERVREADRMMDDTMGSDEVADHMGVDQKRIPSLVRAKILPEPILVFGKKRWYIADVSIASSRMAE